MYCFCCGGDAQQGGDEVKVHGIDARWVGPSSELIELLGVRNGEDADNGAFVGGGREEGAVGVEGHGGER